MIKRGEILPAVMPTGPWMPKEAGGGLVRRRRVPLPK